MSVRAVSWAIDRAPVGGNTTARMILVSLADKADENGRDAYKYVSAIADSIRKSDSTVSRTLAWMEEIGVIERGNQHLVDSYPPYLRPVVYDLRLDLEQEPTPRQREKSRPGRPRKKVKDPEPLRESKETETEKTPSQNETGFFEEPGKPVEANDPNENKTPSQNETGFFEEDAKDENPVAPVHPPRSHGCTHPGRTGALHNVLKHPKTYNPSLPTGDLPAGGETPPDGDTNTNTGTGGGIVAAADTGGSDAGDVIDRLAAMRSGLGLTTAEPTGRDIAKIERLIDAVASANGNDRAIAKGLIARVIEWMPANAWWLGRIDSARRLADNWDKLRNEWVIDLIGRREQGGQAQKDDHAAQGANRGDDRPTPCPPVYRPERHRHTLCCEHVLADMRPHEAEYDHEGSLRYGNPSEWQRACQARADELNRLEGIDVAGAA